MKNASKILKTIMSKLGMEVNLEQMKLNDGVTVIEADMFEAKNEVFIVTEDEQRIALPVGEYELEDGRMLVVEVEGIIAAVNEAQSQAEDEQTPEVEVEVEAEKTPTQNPIAKKVIESTVRESHFSSEEIEAIQKENEELKLKIAELSKVEDVVELEETPKPITFNPENKSEQKINYKIGRNRSESIEDRIFNKLFN
jgi:hypothetical protein